MTNPRLTKQQEANRLAKARHAARIGSRRAAKVARRWRRKEPRLAYKAWKKEEARKAYRAWKARIGAMDWSDWPSEPVDVSPTATVETYEVDFDVRPVDDEGTMAIQDFFRICDEILRGFNR